uniref:Uncharacterized protein n=1 Tax=Oryza nivara TaxID=4536 RepID=A0A0E0G671_ORYNI
MERKERGDLFAPTPSRLLLQLRPALAALPYHAIKDFRKVHLSMLPLQRRSSSRGSSHQHAGPDDQCQPHVLTVPFYHQLVSRSEVVEVEVNGLRQKSSADKRMQHTSYDSISMEFIQVVGDVYLDESISMKAYLLREEKTSLIAHSLSGCSKSAIIASGESSYHHSSLIHLYSLQNLTCFFCVVPCLHGVSLNGLLGLRFGSILAFK